MLIDLKTYKVTNINKHFLELNNHILIDPKRVKLSFGDSLKIGDIITRLSIDYHLTLLEIIYYKGFYENSKNYNLSDQDITLISKDLKEVLK